MKTAAKHSNVSNFPNKKQVMEEASLWLIKLDQGEMQQDQLDELQQWCQRSNFHRSFLEKLARNWEQMSVLSQLAELFPLQQEPEPPSYQRSPKAWFNWGFAGATLACCLSLALLVLLKQPIREWGQQEYKTEVGQRLSEMLDDGSKIILNTDTELRVDYGGDRRVIHLLKGEATFQVAKNPDRPFVVYAGKGMVWAVGTAFNIRYQEHEVDVIVTEGTVKVYAEASLEPLAAKVEPLPSARAANGLKEVIATQGQVVKFNRVIRSHQPQAVTVVQQELAWQKGNLIFNGESLSEVVKELSRYMPMEIEITDASIRDIPVGGNFQLDNSDELLQTLAQGFDLKISRTENGKVLLSNGMRGKAN